MLMITNVSGDKCDILACVKMMHCPSDAITTHKSSKVFVYERGWSATSKFTFSLCEL